MSDSAYLILENGVVFEGEYFGQKDEIIGEIVFNTSMTGYLETLTDQSYYGQIILYTFPLIGNYGITPDFESESIGPSGIIVKYPCQAPSNFRSECSIDTFLKQKKITGLCNIDTRALTKIIRENGVMNGKITATIPKDLTEIKLINIKNSVANVSVKKVEHYKSNQSKYKVALIDFGLKENLKRELIKRNCDVWVIPYCSTLEDIQTINPDGIMLSNGPGNPAENTLVIENLKQLIKLGIPIMGICLGHQLLALAHGFCTYKLKYGHRGANQPVKDLMSGRIYITSQNHGYAVASDSINKKIADEWFVNVNDKTCEGIKYKDTLTFSVQFHPEGCAGPVDTAFIFDRFIKNMEVYKNAVG